MGSFYKFLTPFEPNVFQFGLSRTRMPVILCINLEDFDDHFHVFVFNQLGSYLSECAVYSGLY